MQRLKSSVYLTAFGTGNAQIGSPVLLFRNVTSVIIIFGFSYPPDVVLSSAGLDRRTISRDPDSVQIWNYV